MMNDNNSLNLEDQMKQVDLFMQRKDYVTAIALLDTLICKIESNELQNQEIRINALLTRSKALINNSSGPIYKSSANDRLDVLKVEKDANLNRAISDCTQVLMLVPNNAVAYCHRADAYYHKGRVDRALSDYSWAIDVEPTCITAYMKRGRYYLRNYPSYGDHYYVQAKSDFEKILTLSSNNEDVQVLLEELESKKIAKEKRKEEAERDKIGRPW